MDFCDHGGLLLFGPRPVPPPFCDSQLFGTVGLEALVLFMGLQDFIPGSSWDLFLNVGDSFSLP